MTTYGYKSNNAIDIFDDFPRYCNTQGKAANTRKKAHKPVASAKGRDGISDFGAIASTSIAMFFAAVISGSMGFAGASVIIAFLISALLIGCTVGTIFRIFGL